MTRDTEPFTTELEDPYAIEPCPECGAPDAEFGQHEPGCPSGFPTRDPEGEALQEATREFEDERIGAF
jgi:hypothetical protein